MVNITIISASVDGEEQPVGSVASDSNGAVVDVVDGGDSSQFYS